MRRDCSSHRDWRSAKGSSCCAALTSSALLCLDRANEFALCSSFAATAKSGKSGRFSLGG